nr:hypothetical protein [Cytophagales bacterium]
MYTLIEPEVIHHFFDDDATIVEMLHLILITNIKELKGLKQIFDAGDFEKTRKTCHKSKPTMLYLGATKVRSTLENLERNIPEQFEALYPAFLSEIGYLEAEISAFVNEVISRKN